MAGVIKKGYLDVKMKGMISSTYKRRYVILRRNTDKGSKAVEITETETLDQNDIDIIPLNDAWTVQEKASQNKKRYAFELVVGGNVMMTFSCPSLANREEWTESFHILNKVSAYSPPLNAPDMYSVVLERSLSAVEIGVSGPCLLRLQDSAIVLYSECGRNKLHNWAAENVKNLSLGVEQLLLEAYRPGNKALTEFIFNVEMNVGRQILTSWSMSLLENVDPRKLNLISNYILSTQGNGGGKEASKSNSLSKNFFGTLKQKGSQTNIKDEKVVRRAKSFSDKAGLDVRLSPDPLGGAAVANRLSVSSQESYTINAVPQQGSDDENYHSPPPVPPRAPRRPRSLGMEMIDSARIDPDYSYIKDDKEPAKVSMRGGGRGQSVEKQLEDLEREIDEDNYKRKQSQRRMTLDAVHTTRKATSMYETSKSKTLMASRFSGSFAQQNTPVPKEASDYLEPVPSQRVQEKVEQLARKLSPGGSEIDPVDALLQGLTDTSPVTRSLGPLVSHKAKDHDYSTIPDRVLGSTIAPPPVHFRTTSADSTQSAPELPPRLRRSHGEKGAAMFDDPPSPPRTIQPVSPIRTASYQISLNSGGKVEEISPYATTRGLRLDSSLQMLQSLEPLPPPLPPRSPIKHQRERASMPSVGSHSIKPKQSVAKTKSLADSHIHMSYPSSLKSHVPNYTPKKDCGSLPDLCINSLDQQTSQSSDGGGSTSSRGAMGVSFSTEDRSPTRPESLSSEGSTRQASHDKESLDSALQELDELMKGFDEDGSAKKDSRKQVLHNDIGAALMTTQQIQSDLLSAKENRKTSPDQKTQINRSLSLATSPPAARPIAPSTSSRRSMSSFNSTPTIAGNGKISPPRVGNGKISPPGVPPRSLVSLNNGIHEPTPSSTLRSLTPPNMASANSIHHAPLHRYEKSNTVFIYHIRDQQPVRIAHKSLV